MTAQILPNPVDRVEILSVIDNVMDLLLPSTDVAKRTGPRASARCAWTRRRSRPSSSATVDPKPEIVVDSGISTGAANWIDTNGDASPCESLVPIPVTQRLPRKEKGGSLG